MSEELLEDGTHVIDFGAEIYDRLNAPFMPNSSINDLMEIVANHVRIPTEFVDLNAAAEDYLRRVKGLMEGIGWKLSDDGMEIYKDDPLEDKSDVSMAKTMITRISYIDITAIINAHRDDGYVLAPNGRIFSPDLWMELVGEMKPYIRERIYDTNPPSHQAFADEYARQYREAFGEEWEPYRVNK